MKKNKNRIEKTTLKLKKILEGKTDINCKIEFQILRHGKPLKITRGFRKYSTLESWETTKDYFNIKIDSQKLIEFESLKNANLKLVETKLESQEVQNIDWIISTFFCE